MAVAAVRMAEEQVGRVGRAGQVGQVGARNEFAVVDLSKLVFEYANLKEQADYLNREISILRSQILDCVKPGVKMKVDQFEVSVTLRSNKSLNQDRLSVLLAKYGIPREEFDRAYDVHESPVLSVK